MSWGGGSPPGRVLIVKPSSFGDIIHTLPAVRALRRAWPEADLRWLLQPQWAPLLEGNPDINGVIPFPRAQFRGLKGALRFFSWAADAKAGFRPFLAVDFQGLLRSALAARLLGSRETVGPSDAREGAALLYTRTARADPAAHAVRRYLALAEFLGGRAEPVEFPLPQGAAPAAAAALKPPFLVVHPFARGADKSLSPAQAARLCALLAPQQAVVVGSVGGGGGFPGNTLDLLGATPLPELVWLLRHAAAVVSVDSGPMHLAAAAGTPVVAIHTWSDPARVGPWSDRALVWQNGELSEAAKYLHEGRRGVAGGLPDETGLKKIAEAALGLAARAAQQRPL